MVSPDLYFTSRVHRATRLNILEHARLQRRLQLLDRDRVRQSRLTNQDIRLTSTALDYVLNNSGHSPEGWDPAAGPTAETEVPSSPPSQQLQQLFLYGERVVSRKVHRMSRPLSAAVHYPPSSSSTRHLLQGLFSGATSTTASEVDGNNTTTNVVPRKLTRPYSSPTRGRSTWVRHGTELENKRSRPGAAAADCDQQHRCISGSRASSPIAFFNRKLLVLATGRAAPHQAWEDDVHEVTKKLLKAQQQHQHQQKQYQHHHHYRQQQEGVHLSKSYMRSVGERSQFRAARGLAGGTRRNLNPTYITFPGPSVSGTSSVLSPPLPVKGGSSRSDKSSKNRPLSSRSGKASFVRTV